MNVYHDQIIGGGRVITVYVGGVQIAGAVEHKNSRLNHVELETFWHVAST
jgi:hypothetical protein